MGYEPKTEKFQTINMHVKEFFLLLENFHLAFFYI